MAYKFQLGAFRASGSIVVEDTFEADASTVDSLNVQSGGITNAGAIAGATSIDGSGDLTMGTITMSGFSVDADGDVAMKSLKIDDDSTIGTDSDADMILLDPGADVTIASDLDLIIAKAGGLQLADGAVTSTAAELNLLDGVSGLVKADFTKLAAVDASAAELNHLDGIGDAAYDESADSVVFFDATDNKLKYDAANDFSTRLASDGLKSASGRIELDVNSVANAKTSLAQADLFALADSDASDVTKKITFSNLEDAIFGNVSGDATIAAGGAVTMAAAQTNITSLLATDIKIGEDDQTKIDFETPNEIKFYANNNQEMVIDDNGVVIAGNLTVQGTTTSVNSTTINISSSFTFEGPADDHETVLSCGSPTADATLELFQGAAGTYYMPAFSSNTIKSTVIAATAAEINILDGGNSRGTDALADGDGFIHNDNGTMKQTNVLKMFEYTVAKVSGDATIADTGVLTIAADAIHAGMLNDDVISGQTELANGDAVDADEMLISDGGTLKKIGLDSLKTYMSDVAAVVQNVADSGTLIVGVNYFADMSSDGEDSVTLPASPSVGQSVKVKAPSDCSSARYITINKAGSQTIDGAASIRLESPFAAVELVYVANDLWRVF